MKQWARQIGTVFFVFGVLGFIVSAVVFSGAPYSWSGSLTAALATSLGGASGWAIACGKQSRPSWWRVTIAGLLAGIMLHPYYWILASVVNGELFSASDILIGSLFSLIVVGIITIPAGIVVAMFCRVTLTTSDALSQTKTLTGKSEFDPF